MDFIDIDEQEEKENQKKLKKAESKLKKYQFVNDNDIEQNVEHLYQLKQKKKAQYQERAHENLMKKKAKKYEGRKGNDVDEDSLAIGENAIDLTEDQKYYQKYDKKFNGGIDVVPNPEAEQEQED